MCRSYCIYECVCERARYRAGVRAGGGRRRLHQVMHCVCVCVCACTALPPAPPSVASSVIDRGRFDARAPARIQVRLFQLSGTRWRAHVHPKTDDRTNERARAWLCRSRGASAPHPHPPKRYATLNGAASGLIRALLLARTQTWIYLSAKGNSHVPTAAAAVHFCAARAFVIQETIYPKFSVRA